MPTPRSLITLALSAAAIIASGCANAPGVEITNQTGQTIGVTYLDVAPDGSTKIYSSSILAKGGTLTNQADNDQRGFGKRVRFSLPCTGLRIMAASTGVSVSAMKPDSTIDEAIVTENWR